MDGDGVSADRCWLREQIAFAIWNDTNPPHMREHITLKNVALDPEITTALGDGWKAIQNLGLDWRINRRSFLKLADIAIRAFEAADEDGSAYAPPIDRASIIEECAKVAEDYARDLDVHYDSVLAGMCGEIASAIRSLSSRPASEEGA